MYSLIIIFLKNLLPYKDIDDANHGSSFFYYETQDYAIEK